MHSPSIRQLVSAGLLILMVLAVSGRTYALWTKAYDTSVHQPKVIARGKSWAPDQYRVLYPWTWWTLARVVPERAADRTLLMGTIVFCYGALAFLLRKRTGQWLIAALGLTAFYACCSNWYNYMYRETFLDVGLSLLALILWLEIRRPAVRWGVLAGLSLLGTLNRETWLFLLAGFFCEQVRLAGGLAPWWRGATRKTDLAMGSLTAMTALAALILPRLVYGLKPYYCRVWTWQINLPHLAFWENWPFTLGHGIWSAGAGVFILYLLSLWLGNRRHVGIVLGYAICLLAVSFLMGRWLETRIFLTAFALMLVSILEFMSSQIRAGAESGMQDLKIQDSG